jgi:hypothetical protein
MGEAELLVVDEPTLAVGIGIVVARRLRLRQDAG